MRNILLMLGIGTAFMGVEVFSMSPLTQAVEGHNVQHVEEALKSGVDPNAPDTRDALPLIEAAKDGCVEIVNILLQHGADPNKVDMFGVSPLHEAAINGYVHIVEVLLQHGEDPNKADKIGRSPLREAARNGYVHVVEVLLQYGADPNKAITNGVSPLRQAVRNRYVHFVDMPLQYGADPNTANIFCRSSLHEAARNGYVHIVKVLLQHGADPNKANIIGRSPLHEAARSRYIHIVKVLLQHGADPNIGWPLLLEASEKGHIDIVDILLQHGADPNKAITSGVTPLHEAARNGYVRIVEVLLQHGADPSIGCPLLLEASEKGYIDIVNILLQHGADPNKVDTIGISPLHEAARNGYVHIVRVLLQHGADPDTVHNNGNTPLYEAARESYTQMYHSLEAAYNIWAGHGYDNNAEEARIALGSRKYAIAGEIMQQLDSSQAASVLLHALMLEHARGDASVHDWIESHVTQAAIQETVERICESAENGAFTASVFVHMVRRIAEHTNEHVRLSSITREPYATLYQILYPRDVRDVLNVVTARIASNEATLYEIELVCQLYADSVAYLRDVDGDVFITHVVRIPRLTPYLKTIIPFMCERALIFRDGESHGSTVVRDLAYLTAVARDVGNYHGVAILRKARALFIRGFYPEVIDNILAFLPNTEDAAVEQQP